MQETKKYWFKVKNYGWGWTPSTWQGWFVLALFVLVNIYIFKDIEQGSYSTSSVFLNFILPSILSVVVLIIICYRTGEKPGWRWGKKD